MYGYDVPSPGLRSMAENNLMKACMCGCHQKLRRAGPRGRLPPHAFHEVQCRGLRRKQASREQPLRNKVWRDISRRFILEDGMREDEQV